MKPSLLVSLLSAMLAAAPPLQVAGVMRTGLPPYEDSERLYRLEGEGCQALRMSECLTLRRGAERRNLGRLQVTAIKDGYALARLAVSGETYPLKGDLAVRHEMVAVFPVFSQRAPEAMVPMEAFAPRLPKLPVPSSVSKKDLHPEPIFFVKGNAELSPAARVKLRSWVGAWGLDGRWALLVPLVSELPSAISQARVEALKEALKELGVIDVEVRPLPSGPAAKYDSISVSKEPW